MMGWKGEKHNHSLCAKGIRVRKNIPKKKFIEKTSVEVRWEGGSKELSVNEVNRGNIERAITEDDELKKELLDNEKQFHLYAKGKELIITIYPKNGRK